ncbi:MAG: hypothetical protein GY812_06295 [Actinomycetia bacterium]|nr:hypothetical protein [Actinomycetes bacterium]
MVGRIGRREQFSHLRAHGFTVRDGGLRIRAARLPEDAVGTGPAVAYSIGRGAGTAVRRNRLRRRLRAVFANAEHDGRLHEGWYLVTVLPSSEEPAYAQLDSWASAALSMIFERLAAPGTGL